ncbi:MAG TPA: hypothetical protein VMO78_07395 [Rhizomicrobium sp.]|nr:hypothetical protein [Rhizomicrobium sp.]
MALRTILRAVIGLFEIAGDLLARFHDARLLLGVGATRRQH